LHQILVDYARRFAEKLQRFLAGQAGFIKKKKLFNFLKFYFLFFTFYFCIESQTDAKKENGLKLIE
jgi:hypothetical protein